MVYYLKIFFTALLFCACNDDRSQSSVPVSPVDTVLTTIDTSIVKLVGLPFSFKESEKRKNEIYSMALTTKYLDWKNPTSGGAVHITKKDEIEVYHFTFGIWKGKNDSMVVYGPSPKDTSIIVNPDEIWPNVSGIGLGNATSVLITSEYDLKKSISIKTIMDTLFKPGVQIYYLKRK